MLNFSSAGLQLGAGGEVWIKKCTSPIERNLTNLLKLIFHISLVLACNMVILVDTFKKRYTVDYGTNIRYCISSNNNRPSINRLPRIIPPPFDGNIEKSPPSNNCLPSPLSPFSLSFIPSLSSWSGFWSSDTDQWWFKLWKLIMEPNLEHFKNPYSVYLMQYFFV